MSEFVIALNEDIEMLDGEKYNTLEEAKSVATRILKRLHDDSSKTIEDFDDKVSGYLDVEGEPVDNLTILEINPACFPDFGDMIFDGLENYSISEGNLDDEWPEGVTDKDLTELNELVAEWMTSKGYKPNWYNVEHSYLVELEEK